MDAEALLPDGPYDLWRDDEDARFVKDLAGAFARDPRLPKMLNARVVLDTVLQGVKRGLFVARLARPDGSGRTWWREPVEEQAQSDPTLEVALPHKAMLTALPVGLLAPDALPDLWQNERLDLEQAKRYFSGEHAVTIAHDGWDEELAIPGCDEAILEAALAKAVSSGTAWMLNGPTSCWKEDVPFTALDEEAELLPPPQMPAPSELTQDELPDAWTDGETNGAAMVRALSRKRRVAVPWGLVREGLTQAVRSRWLETVAGDATVEFDRAGEWRLKQPESHTPQKTAAAASALEMDAAQVQNLADALPELMETSAGYGLRFRVGVALDAKAPEDVRRKVDELLVEAAPGLKSDTDDGAT